jgi:hypothetical protein
MTITTENFNKLPKGVDSEEVLPFLYLTRERTFQSLSPIHIAKFLFELNERLRESQKMNDFYPKNFEARVKAANTLPQVLELSKEGREIASKKIKEVTTGQISEDFTQSKSPVVQKLIEMVKKSNLQTRYSFCSPQSGFVGIF